MDRQIKRVQQNAGASAVTVELAYDGWTQTVTREDASGGAEARAIDYTLDPTGTPATAYTTSSNAAPAIEYLAQDGAGNTGLTTATDGTSRCAARYDAYGNPDTNNPSAPSAPLGSCASGQSASDVFYRANRKDTATGNYQLGSRTYDPSKAAFLTPDSYRTGGSDANTTVGIDPLTRNTYSYVNGDPINRVDPSGHMATPPDGGGGGTADGPAAWERLLLPGGLQMKGPAFYHEPVPDAKIAVRTNAAANKLAVEYGYSDAHALKDAAELPGSSYDIYRDDAGNLFVARKGHEQDLAGRSYITDKSGNYANMRIGGEGRPVTQVPEPAPEVAGPAEGVNPSLRPGGGLGGALGILGGLGFFLGAYDAAHQWVHPPNPCANPRYYWSHCVA